MLAYIKSKGYDVYALTFKYGQMSRQEVNTALELTSVLGVREHKVIDISFMKELYKGSNILTESSTSMSVPSEFDYSIVVPIRNAVFITIATAYALSINAGMVAYGAHRDDHNYPDCRVEFVSSIEHALNLADIDGISRGLRERVRIWSPAIDGLSKSDLVSIGYRLLGDTIFKTWSCYTDGIIMDDELTQCGRCESCNNRKKAFSSAGIEDLTRYAS
jgi:7-cyano-7-deazaguanine synthase